MLFLVIFFLSFTVHVLLLQHRTSKVIFHIGFEKRYVIFRRYFPYFLCILYFNSKFFFFLFSTFSLLDMAPIRYSDPLLLYSWFYEKIFGSCRIFKSALNEVNFTLLQTRNDRGSGWHISSLPKEYSGISLKIILLVYP